MIFRVKRLIRKILLSLGYVISKAPDRVRHFPVELSKAECKILDDVLDRRLTMVNFEGLLATLMACKYVLENSIEGDFVECGVWRGGNAIVAAEMFRLHGSQKHVWLFDTFLGMTAPTGVDHDWKGGLAQGEFDLNEREGFNNWCYASIEDVVGNFEDRGLVGNNIHFIKGDVSQTLREADLPEKISVLRLDTDWYESTKMECEVLYPRLSVGGCLIVDDYGHWNGSRIAIDEYFSQHLNRPFFHATDYARRIGVKLTK